MKIIAGFLLACVTLAVSSTATSTSTCIDANYEDKAGGVVGPPMTVGVYKSLLYKTFQYVSDTAVTVGGLTCHTRNICILTTSQSQGSGAGTTPSLTVQSPYKSFTLRSFWFGCTVPSEQAVAGQTTQCTVTVAGYVGSSGNQEVAVASFTFTPPTVAVAQTSMTQAKLPSSFAGLQTVTIVQGSPLTQALIVDDVDYCLNK